jgi:hypothetical protein
MAVYGAACLVSIIAAARGTAPLAASAMVGLIALAWGLFWASTSQATLGV